MLRLFCLTNIRKNRKAATIANEGGEWLRKNRRRQLTMLKVLVPGLEKRGNAYGNVRSEDEEMTAERMLKGEVAE